MWRIQSTENLHNVVPRISWLATHSYNLAPELMLLTIISTASGREAQAGPSQWNDKTCPPIVCEAWLLLAHLWVGLTLRLGGLGIGHAHCAWAAVWGLIPGAEFVPAESDTCGELALDMPRVQKEHWVVFCGLQSATWCVGFGASYERLWWELMSETLPLTSLGLPVKNYTVGYCLCWSVCMLEWPRCEPRLAFTSTKPRAGQKKALGTPDSPTPTCYWPIRLSPWKSLRQYEDCVVQDLRELLGRGKWESSSY